jgi:hypothetical protein
MSSSERPIPQTNTAEETIISIIKRWKNIHWTGQNTLSLLLELLKMRVDTKTKLRESLAETNEKSDASNLWIKEGFYLYELKDIKEFINMSQADLLTEYFNVKYHDPYKPKINFSAIAAMLETVLKNMDPAELTQWITKLNHTLNRGISNHHFSDNDTLAHLAARQGNFPALQALASIDPDCLGYFNIQPANFWGSQTETVSNPKTALDLMQSDEEKVTVKMIALRKQYLRRPDLLHELQFREKYAVDETQTAEFLHFANTMMNAYSLALDAFANTLENDAERNAIQKAIQALCATIIPLNYEVKELQDKVNNLQQGQSVFIHGGFRGGDIGHHALIFYSKDHQGIVYRTECNAGFGSYRVDEHNCYGVCTQQIQAGKIDEVIALDHSNYSSSQEKYITINKNLELLAVPIKNQSLLVGTQQTYNCNTRSTRELIRCLLPAPLFRKMYDYLVNTKPEEMLETIQAKYEDKAPVSNPYQNNKQRVFKNGNDIHRETA